MPGNHLKCPGWGSGDQECRRGRRKGLSSEKLSSVGVHGHRAVLPSCRAGSAGVLLRKRVARPVEACARSHPRRLNHNLECGKLMTCLETGLFSAAGT